MLHFEWDPMKALTNQRKHKLGFEEAILAFEDDYAILEEDRIGESGEFRWRTIGLVKGVLVVLVVHTMRELGADVLVRVISARKATRQERKQYEQART